MPLPLLRDACASRARSCRNRRLQVLSMAGLGGLSLLHSNLDEVQVSVSHVNAV